MHALRVRRVAAAIAVMGVVPAAAEAAAPRLGANAADQVAALQAVKQDLSPAERKLDGRLAVELRKRAGGKVKAAAPDAATGVKGATTEVDIRARVTRQLLGRLAKRGAQVRYASRRVGSIRATVPVAALERIAALGAVRRVDSAVGAITARMGRAVSRESKAAKGGSRARWPRRASRPPR